MANGIQVLPTLDRYAGLRQGAMNFATGQIQQQQKQRQLSDTQALLQFIQQTQQGATPGLPNFQTPGAAMGLVNFLGQQQPGPFTLGQGQQRFGPGGQQIAQVAPAPIPRAGAMQIARQGDPSGLPIGTVFQADPKGNIKVLSEAGGEGLTAKDRANLAVTQAKEFRTDERIKNLQIIERSERGMKAALKQATSPNVKSRIASDQALGVLFQKMLDPTSVVRESEFARTPEGASVINQLLAIAPKIRLGGLKLLDEDRQALVTMAQKLLDEAKVTANKAFSEFGVRADELNLNKRIVFGGAKPFDIVQPEFVGPPGSAALSGQLQQGEILVRQKSTGQIGALPAGEFDPNLYERAQ